MSQLIVDVQDPSGKHQRLTAQAGLSLMEVLVAVNIAGIEAECGGECSCATCHVIVDLDWAGKLVPPSELEADMLEFAKDERTSTSRLSCQIKLTAELDGLKVSIPKG